jgi:hypothetical protein
MMYPKYRRVSALAVVIAMISLLTSSAPAAVSNPTVIWSNPDVSLQWKTVMSENLQFALDWPAGAVMATLTINRGRDESIITVTDTSAATLPVRMNLPADEQSESTLLLTLAYKDAAATVLDTQTARLGLVRGINTNTVRCVLDTTSKLWNVVKVSAVLPVPEQTASLTIDGAAVEPLDSPGWYWWKIREQKNYELVLTDTRSEATAVTLSGRPRVGLVIVYK